ncbi:Tf2-11, partial [Mucuna pruriens]
MSTSMARKLDLIEQFKDLILVCEVTPKGVRLSMFKITRSLLCEIRVGNQKNPLLARQIEVIDQGNASSFVIGVDGVIFWWPTMKREVAEFIYNCLVCQKGTLHQALGIKVSLSSAYHLQTNGQIERTIQSLEDILRACMLEQQGSWDNLLPLLEFTYYNSYHSNIRMTPYEALYNQRCRTPLCWFVLSESLVLGSEVVQQTTKKIKLTQEKMKVTKVGRRAIVVREVRISNSKKGTITPWTRVDRALKSCKLSPRFISPYQIIKRVGKVTYQVALPPYSCKFAQCFSCFSALSCISHLSYEVLLMRVEDCRIKQLRGKEISKEGEL